MLIDITKNAQFEEVEFNYKKRTAGEELHAQSETRSDGIDMAAELINNAERPFVLCGQGVTISRAEDEFKEFVEKAGIPVGNTLNGLSAFPEDHPLSCGYAGNAWQLCAQCEYQ